MAKDKGMKMDAAMVGLSPTDSADYSEIINIPFPLNELMDLKLGQEVVISITGCVCKLEGSEYYSSVGLHVTDKKWRRTSNTQAEGIKKLSGEDDDDSEEE